MSETIHFLRAYSFLEVRKIEHCTRGNEFNDFAQFATPYRPTKDKNCHGFPDHEVYLIEFILLFI